MRDEIVIFLLNSCCRRRCAIFCLGERGESLWILMKNELFSARTQKLKTFVLQVGGKLFTSFVVENWNWIIYGRRGCWWFILKTIFITRKLPRHRSWMNQEAKFSRSRGRRVVVIYISDSVTGRRSQSRWNTKNLISQRRDVSSCWDDRKTLMHEDVFVSERKISFQGKKEQTANAIRKLLH